jgi:cyclomaltodextrinase / maltogenic alpha-amylase / neopullulanase
MKSTINRIKLWSIFMGIIFMSFTSVGARAVNNPDKVLGANYEAFNKLQIYQIMVESYQNGDTACDYNTGYGPSNHKGDLKGIIHALPYIKSLGINAIWLTPIFDSDGNSKLDATGYFCKNYFKIDPKFGTLEDARNLVNKAHKLGLYVFFDGVFGHHKTGVMPSPKGNKLVDFSAKGFGSDSSAMATTPEHGSDVSFPGSLEFFKEVATYWIDELEIDGWRLDQCYQLSFKGGQDKNYWKDIREAVEAKCIERKISGKKWGVIGYMVGEDWDEAKNIQANTYSGDGLRSAFDFPSRYDIVKMLACDSERKASDTGAKALSSVYATSEQKGYSHKDGVYPNLFISNHDLVRFGNLINWKFGLNRNDDEYWKRHKCALSILAAYTGPITIYYGDEYGDMEEGYTGQPQPDQGIANDNIGRSNGKCSDFSSKENELVNYTTKIMNIRKNNPALYDGIRMNLVADSSLYADYKTKGNNKIIFIVNIGKKDISYKVSKKIVGGKGLINIENNASCAQTNEDYIIHIPQLSAGFYRVQ